jgi:S-adenosylmethionine:tRNA ribosyltransferase-isomerase
MGWRRFDYAAPISPCRSTIFSNNTMGNDSVKGLYMRVDLFDFELPPERIAHAPVTPRDAARLLHVTAEGLVDRTVRDLPALLSPGDVLVVNNSRVIPARLFTMVGGRQVEILLHQPQAKPEHGASCQWLAFARPARKLKAGMRLSFAADFEATVEGRTEDGQVVLVFPYAADALFAKLRQHGHMPLPPYIDRADTASDQADYQTVYAAQDGSVAAPTAGLHFTPELLAALAAFIVWIARLGQGRQDEYDIFYAQSVSGLANGS